MCHKLLVAICQSFRAYLDPIIFKFAITVSSLTPKEAFGCIWYMGVEPKIGGKPPKWMVYNGKPYEQMDDLGGPPLFLETPLYFRFLGSILRMAQFFFGQTQSQYIAHVLIPWGSASPSDGSGFKFKGQKDCGWSVFGGIH